MELYEELEAQEAQQQREQMELLEFKVRMEKLEAVMNFIEGATSNMQIDDENAKSEEEINNPPKQNQAATDEKEKEKEKLVHREVKIQPAIA
jgi:DNA-binding transcriptional regulator YbjK